MTPLDIFNVAFTFVVGTAPVAVAVGLIGHALSGSKYVPVRRAGLILEGIGTDWRRVSEAFRGMKKEDPK